MPLHRRWPMAHEAGGSAEDLGEAILGLHPVERPTDDRLVVGDDDRTLQQPRVAQQHLDDRVDADDVVEACAANGILDIGGYRKLGRNQLRISMFPGVDPADIQALTGCLDYVVGELAE